MVTPRRLVAVAAVTSKTDNGSLFIAAAGRSKL